MCSPGFIKFTKSANIYKNNWKMNKKNLFHSKNILSVLYIQNKIFLRLGRLILILLI